MKKKEYVREEEEERKKENKNKNKNIVGKSSSFNLHVDVVLPEQTKKKRRREK